MFENNIPSFIFRIEAWYERDLAQATHRMEYTVQFLLMELESVGNIRLEEGCSTDPWYSLGIFIHHVNSQLQGENKNSFLFDFSDQQVYVLLRPCAFPLFSFRLRASWHYCY